MLRVDRFGNLITNVDRRSFEQFAAGRPIEIDRGRTSGDETGGGLRGRGNGINLRAVRQSTDHLEIALTGGSAAEQSRSRGAERRW